MPSPGILRRRRRCPEIMSENNVLLMFEIPLLTFRALIMRKTAVYTSKKNTTDVRPA